MGCGFGELPGILQEVNNHTCGTCAMNPNAAKAVTKKRLEACP